MLESRACVLARGVGDVAHLLGISVSNRGDPDCGELMLLCLSGKISLGDLFR